MTDDVKARNWCREATANIEAAERASGSVQRHGSVSDEVLAMVFAFGDKDRQDAVRAIASRVKNLEDYVKQCRDDFDCDHDAHRYNTMCRACRAAWLIPNNSICVTETPKTNP